MATRINLLPWREERRQQRQKEFLLMVVAAVILAVGIVYLGDNYYQGRIAYQEERNELLRSEISKLEDQLQKISELKETKRQLVNRMEVIQDLQKGRPQIVHMFEELVTTLPSQLYLERVQDRGNRISISGVAVSNARVADYMTNLQNSPWFQSPDLGRVEEQDQGDSTIYQFSLSVKQASPDDQSDNNSGGGQ